MEGERREEVVEVDVDSLSFVRQNARELAHARRLAREVSIMEIDEHDTSLDARFVEGDFGTTAEWGPEPKHWRHYLR